MTIIVTSLKSTSDETAQHHVSGRAAPKPLEKALKDAASKAHAERKNDALNDTKHPELTAQMIQWRKEANREPRDGAQSAGAYWAWTDAAKFADQLPAWERMTQHTDNHKAAIVYTAATASVRWPLP
jgi:hypothetical protein